MTAALEQGTAPQSEASINMSHLPRSPVVHPIWAPQLYQAREPTTFEMMGMIGDLQRSVADLAYGKSASPPAAPYAGNFIPQEPPLLGRIVIELSQPEVASSCSHDMPAPTQTLDQAEARGKDKMKADADPMEQLLWAVEALKARGMNKQQTSAIVTKAVEDAFPTPIKGSSSQAENRDGPRHAQTIPVVPNPVPGRGQKAKAVLADPFASASSKNPQTSKYLPRGHRAFHDLYMPLSRALLILAKNGHLKPLEPWPLPKNLPATHDATLYCAYHQQSGHSTDGCFRLRHEVQDLIDNKVILPPTSSKSVTTQLLDFEGSDTAIQVPEDLNGLKVHLAYSPARQTHCISLSFSKTPFEHCGDKNEEEGTPLVLQNFDHFERKRSMLSLLMNEIMLVGVSTGKDPGLIQIGNFIMKSSPQRFHSVSVHAMVLTSSQSLVANTFQGDCVHIFVMTAFVVFVSKNLATTNEDYLRTAATSSKQGATFRCHESPFKPGATFRCHVTFFKPGEIFHYLRSEVAHLKE
ncbi:hypothetical protein HYC85_030394 [Camellia sinensis]|uniref:Uncharacterized protein n=1 Tax=Camellia sinensis TaxID=4442 RepID=A0A7J7G0L5_CAMSI|nr:hypothetical protein HYC85_030394 [Camellia sinensis]